MKERADREYTARLSAEAYRKLHEIALKGMLSKEKDSGSVLTRPSQPPLDYVPENSSNSINQSKTVTMNEEVVKS